MSIWRLLNTGALPGALNMAIDQALLQLHALGLSPPTLRFYQWQPPAVSIGYFQQPEAINLSLCSSLGIDVVRRPTGGRAVLHQNELTYSLIAGTKEGIPSSLPKAYDLICEGLLAGFRLIRDRSPNGSGKADRSSAGYLFSAFVHQRHCLPGEKICGKRPDVERIFPASTRLDPSRTSKRDLGESCGNES